MSRITNKQVQYLIRHPQAMMKYQMTGRLPATVRPSSPLITLLESLPSRLRLEIRGVRINPALGYLGGMQFHNAQQLLNWLKPAEEMIVSQSWPAESYRDKRFARRLSLQDLKPFCAAWPDERVWNHFRIDPDKHQP